MESGAKVTCSKATARKEPDTAAMTVARKEPDTLATTVSSVQIIQGHTPGINETLIPNEGAPESDPGEDESLDLIIKNPELPPTILEDVVNQTSVPPIQENIDDRALIWERLKAAQKSGDTFLAKILLETYNAKESKLSVIPELSRSESAAAVLSTIETGKTKELPNPIINSRLAETELEDNLVYAVGAVTNHQDIGFTPYFDENIRKLRAPLPLTIFDKDWQKKALSAHLLLKPAKSSEDKAYRGLAFNDEWTQSHSAWTNNHRSFYITLRDVYNKKLFAEKLLRHKENCDNIADVYGFMTAFRYDMQIRLNAFAHWVPSKDGAAIPDISVKQLIVVEQCYSTVRSFGEANWKDNYYAPGQSHASYDPDTGAKRPELIKAASFPNTKNQGVHNGPGGFNSENHQGRRKEARRFGRNAGQDNWGRFNYGGYQGYSNDHGHYGYANNYSNHQNDYGAMANQFQTHYNQGSGYMQDQGMNDGRKRFRPSQNQGDQGHGGGQKKGGGGEKAGRKP
ncbi:hypothetical protein PGT21_014245 [Puccinia graminis f. sp. tritici]|uniref:Uncharacterized protein n=1 Tax=Puccinia graminis f. sp. tritici TaxID=56615 RepID=A0A5B0NY66_PUCGR|nr:hypothetical protein PGTUg99_023533 [Puccinia graminis f. sp. tritici]KAA1094227.1 hypothetical protein PGT21_014245 [Puccinia graminis f. sp. tritici]